MLHFNCLCRNMSGKMCVSHEMCCDHWRHSGIGHCDGWTEDGDGLRKTNSDSDTGSARRPPSPDPGPDPDPGQLTGSKCRQLGWDYGGKSSSVAQSVSESQDKVSSFFLGPSSFFRSKVVFCVKVLLRSSTVFWETFGDSSLRNTPPSLFDDFLRNVILINGKFQVTFTAETKLLVLLNFENFFVSTCREAWHCRKKSPWCWSIRPLLSYGSTGYQGA